MSRLSQSLLNWVFPTANACHLCQRALEGTENCLCSRCTAALMECRLPEESRESLVLSQWLALSAFQYRDQARDLVRLLKYQGDFQAGQMLGESMALALVQSGLRVELLLPVPMHPVRLRQRGYNQAEQLARQVSQRTGISVYTNGLYRKGSLQTQVHRTREERLTALKDVFWANEAVVKNRRILLIDDVLTTGATAGACAKALTDAGAGRVTVLTACRV